MPQIKTFKQYCNFEDLETKNLQQKNTVYFITRSTIFNILGVAAPTRHFHKGSVTDSLNADGVCKAAPGFALVC